MDKRQGAGFDTVAGDNAGMAWDVNGILLHARSTATDAGDDDTISLFDGGSAGLGGLGDDGICSLVGLL